MELGRPIDLSLPVDRQHLLDALGVDDEGVPDGPKALDAYLRYFPAGWRIVHAAGFVAASNNVLSVGQLLRTAYALETLSSSEGFQRLLRGFRNPSEIASTLFVAAAAEWCAGRRVHHRIVFEPEIVARGGLKRPDFQWFTDVGEPYCECKQARFVGSRVEVRANRLANWAAECARGSAAGLPETERIDLWVQNSLHNGWEGRVKRVVAEAISAYPSRHVLVEGEIKAVVRPRTERPPRFPASVTIAHISVGATPTLLDITNAPVSASLSVRNARRKALQRLIREAREQLPSAGPGAVFVDIRGASSFEDEVRRIIAQPRYAAVAWAGLFDMGGPVLAVWRDGQPLDGRLTQ